MKNSIGYEAGLPLLVDRVARSAPARRALIHAGVVITYEELRLLSDEVSASLIRSGCGVGDRVVTMLPHSAAAIVALLGIHKAGCVAVPLAPGTTSDSLLSLITLCQCKMVLAFPDRLLSLSDPGDKPPTVRLDGPAHSTVMGISLFAVATTGDLVSPTNGDHIAEILMHDQGGCSPKGVMVSHGNIAALADWSVSGAGVAPTDRICGANPLYTGLSLFDVAAAFCAGAELHIPPGDVQREPTRLMRWLQETDISLWLARPEALRRIVHAGLSTAPLSALRHLLWCGGVLPVRALMYLMDRLPATMFTNVYGQLETAIAACTYEVSVRPPAADMVTPLGTGVDGTLVQVLNDDLEPASQGEIGRLCVSGPGVVPGYWRDVAATQNTFCRDANGRRWFVTGDMGYMGYDGLLYLVGRSSQRFRCAGHEVFIAAVEQALGCLNYVNDVAVVPCPGDLVGDRRLACAYVPAKRGCVRRTRKRLERDLGALLPDHMVPARWVELSDLPLTVSGKLDRSLITRMISVGQRKGAKANV